MQINVYEAKTQLSRLLDQVAGGAEVVIARAGHPVARLVPFDRVEPRQPGGWAGRWWLADDWDSAATNEEAARGFDGDSVLPTSGEPG